jgi:hypothetical protein
MASRSMEHSLQAVGHVRKTANRKHLDFIPVDMSS